MIESPLTRLGVLRVKRRFPADRDQGPAPRRRWRIDGSSAPSSCPGSSRPCPFSGGFRDPCRRPEEQALCGPDDVAPGPLRRLRGSGSRSLAFPDQGRAMLPEPRNIESKAIGRARHSSSSPARCRGEAPSRTCRRTSRQADRRVLEALTDAGAEVILGEERCPFGAGQLKAFEFDATDCPDLFPPLGRLACFCRKSRIAGAGRLSHKESDRAAALVEELSGSGRRSSPGRRHEVAGSRSARGPSTPATITGWPWPGRWPGLAPASGVRVDGRNASRNPILDSSKTSSRSEEISHEPIRKDLPRLALRRVPRRMRGRRDRRLPGRPAARCRRTCAEDLKRRKGEGSRDDRAPGKGRAGDHGRLVPRPHERSAVTVVFREHGMSVPATTPFSAKCPARATPISWP